MKFYLGVRDTIDPALFKSRAKRAAHFVAEQAAQDMQPFVPARSGNLRSSLVIDGRKVHWKTPYAGVIHYGILMVDPDYKVGGFPLGNGAFFSRRGVKKVASSKQLHYSTGEKNWIEVGKERYMDRWLKMAARAMLNEREI